MTDWLLKTEPSDYSFADLVRDGSTTWTGVRNALAQRHLRAMKAGDRVLVYHTGAEKAVVGVAQVTRPATGDDPAVTLAPHAALAAPVPLAAIKADKRFADWGLVKIGRLSVVPTSREQFEAILVLGGGLGR